MADSDGISCKKAQRMKSLEPDPDSNITPPFSPSSLIPYRLELIPHSFASLPPAPPSFEAQNETIQTPPFSPPSSTYHVHLNGGSNYRPPYPMNFLSGNTKIGEVGTDQGIGSSISMATSPDANITRQDPGQHDMGVNRWWQPAVQPQWDEQYRSLAKEFRHRRRLARQKKHHNSGCSQFACRPCIRKNSSMHPTSYGTVVAHDSTSGTSFLPHMNMKLNFVLLKELTRSDVSNAGRIVLPKRESEAHLPYLHDKEGIELTVRDVFTSCAWQMKFKFWLNNHGRQYVLVNTGDFVKKHDLKHKDLIVLYQDESNQFYICARKTNASTSQLEPTASTIEEEPNSNKQILIQSNKLSEQEQSGEAKRSSGDSNTNGAPSMMEIGEPSSADLGLRIDTQMAEVEVNNLPELEEFPGFDEYGLSIHDLRPGDKYDSIVIK